MSKFQLILTGVFGAFILVGVMVFALSKGSTKPVVSVTMWGTIPNEVFNSIYNQSTLTKSKTVSLTYVAKNPATFNDDFVQALASGVGPDVIFLPHDEILKNQNKIFPIPYGSYQERTFRDTYAQEAELLLRGDGILAIPTVIDPLVMYWNRSTFNNASLSQPPVYWDDFHDLAPLLTVKDGALNITKSAIALGGFNNINNAKAILSTLFFQAGSPIVSVVNGSVTSVLVAQTDKPVLPAISALAFYTDFSNPASKYYSWNPSLQKAQNMFAAGDLAVYFGFASELSLLQQKNPNLNFDIAMIPQSKNNSDKITFGTVHSLALVKNSRNIPSAYTAITELTSANSVSIFANVLRLPPARRDLLAVTQKDPYQSVFYKSAIASEGFLDPDSFATGRIFQTLIEVITGGQAKMDLALNNAQLQLQSLINKQQ